MKFYIVSDGRVTRITRRQWMRSTYERIKKPMVQKIAQNDVKSAQAHLKRIVQRVNSIERAIRHEDFDSVTTDDIKTSIQSLRRALGKLDKTLNNDPSELKRLALLDH